MKPVFIKTLSKSLKKELPGLNAHQQMMIYPNRFSMKNKKHVFLGFGKILFSFVVRFPEKGRSHVALGVPAQLAADQAALLGSHSLPDFGLSHSDSLTASRGHSRCSPFHATPTWALVGESLVRSTRRFQRRRAPVLEH